MRAIAVGLLLAWTLPANADAQPAAGGAAPSLAVLEQLALSVGRANASQPIAVVARELTCSSPRPGVDTAARAACAALDSVAARAIARAFAQGVGDRPLVNLPTDPARELPLCAWPGTEAAEGAGRYLLATLSAPVIVGAPSRWEARVTVEVSCRQERDGGQRRSRYTAGREYHYRWDGRAWTFVKRGWTRTTE